MTLPRRRFLGSSLIALGGTLLDALATPIWKWRNPVVVEAATDTTAAVSGPVFRRGPAGGLDVPNVWGGVDHKRLIIETKGSGIAFFDYDNDGWLDIYLTNGSRLDAHWPAGPGPHHASVQKQS